MTYLDFSREAQEESTSWTRADPRSALIERIDPVTFRVLLEDGSDSHEVHYAKERNAFVGFCDCKGFEYRPRDDSPCAHLCALRKAEFLGLSDSLGLPVYAQDSSEMIESGASEIEPDLVADGGQIEAPPAGHDDRVFGRPSQRL